MPALVVRDERVEDQALEVEFVDRRGEQRGERARIECDGRAQHVRLRPRMTLPGDLRAMRAAGERA
jgi:hypothetical protein